jgi:hypothetical protein
VIGGKRFQSYLDFSVGIKLATDYSITDLPNCTSSSYMFQELDGPVVSAVQSQKLSNSGQSSGG